MFTVHGQSILRVLQETVGVTHEKENTTTNGRRSKPPSRGSSAPPRAKTPSYAPSTSHGNGATTRTRSNSKSDVVTPAVRPGSSMSRSTSKRARLGESTSSHNNVPPMPSGTRIPSQRPASPSKIPGKTPTTSSLPRPVPLAMPVPKPGTQHHVLGHGRVPTSQLNHHSHSYHPYPQTQRSTSAGGVRVYGAIAVVGTGGTAGAARKASRVRRESFKPRPSIDEAWTDAGGGKRWPGFAGGAVREEDEDF